MNKFLKILVIIIMIAMCGATIMQLFFPHYMGEHSGFGVALGWQREIAFWNIAIIVILIGVMIRYDWFYLRLVLLAFIVGGSLIGGNHLLYFLRDHKAVNAVGAMENFLLVIGWIVGYLIERRKEERNIQNH